MADLNLTRTYVTNAAPTPEVGSQLLAYAELFSAAVRGTYSKTERDMRAGLKPSDAERKAWVSKTYGLTSRQAHAVLVEADGKRDSILELEKGNLEDLQRRLHKQKSVVARGKKDLAEHRQGTARRIHKTKRLKIKASVFHAQTKVAKLTAKIKKLKARMDRGITHLTFGTKKLLRQRGALDAARAEALKARDMSAVAELDRRIEIWCATWKIARETQIFVVGSKDETAGCLGCQATLVKNGENSTISLDIKLPNAMGGERVTVEGLHFAYGQNQLSYALLQQAVRTVSKQELTVKALAFQTQFMGPPKPAPAPEFDADGKPVKPKKPTLFSQKEIKGGSAITWRFMYQADGSLKVAFSTDVPMATLVTDVKRGVIGVDLNSGFLSVTETNQHGNFLDGRNYLIPEIGKSADQREAARGDAVAAIIKRCVAAKKPLALEDLDFTAKKRDLSARNPSSKRKLSALAYKAIYELFCARARDAGVEVITVNPAYTSTQGLVRYASQKGWSVHIAAAGVIARRAQGLSEVAPTAGKLRLPVEGTAVELGIPEEVSKSDVSCRWGVLHRAITQAIASHYRSRRRAGSPRKKGAAVFQNASSG